jgi:hypothetical protein
MGGKSKKDSGQAGMTTLDTKGFCHSRKRSVSGILLGRLGDTCN